MWIGALLLMGHDSHGTPCDMINNITGWGGAVKSLGKRGTVCKAAWSMLANCVQCGWEVSLSSSEDEAKPTLACTAVDWSTVLVDCFHAVSGCSLSPSVFLYHISQWVWAWGAACVGASWCLRKSVCFSALKVLYASPLVADKMSHMFKSSWLHFLVLTPPLLYICCEIICLLPKHLSIWGHLRFRVNVVEVHPSPIISAYLPWLEYIAANLRATFHAMLVHKIGNLQLFVFHLRKYYNKKFHLGEPSLLETV